MLSQRRARSLFAGALLSDYNHALWLQSFTTFAMRAKSPVVRLLGGGALGTSMRERRGVMSGMSLLGQVCALGLLRPLQLDAHGQSYTVSSDSGYLSHWTGAQAAWICLCRALDSACGPRPHAGDCVWAGAYAPLGSWIVLIMPSHSPFGCMVLRGRVQA